MTAAQDLFWLSHYTYNTINPLVQEGQLIEPSIALTLNTIFAHSEAPYSKEHQVEAHLHWKREGMFALSPTLCSKADVDKFAETLRTKLDALQRPKGSKMSEAGRRMYANAFA